MQVGHVFLARAAADVRMHRPALHGGARPDERDLDDEVVVFARLQPGERAHLRARLDLEHADRVGPAQHVVHRRLFFRDGLQRELLARRLAHEVERVLQGCEHAEPEQVELHEPHPRAVVFVPLQHGAILHARVLDRHDLAHRAIGEHHAARVDAEVAGGEGQHLLGELDDGPPRDVVVVGLDDGPPQRSTWRDHASCWPVE